jgi:hypothetical protein
MNPRGGPDGGDGGNGGNGGNGSTIKIVLDENAKEFMDRISNNIIE